MAYNLVGHTYFRKDRENFINVVVCDYFFVHVAVMSQTMHQGTVLAAKMLKVSMTAEFFIVCLYSVTPQMAWEMYNFV